MLGWMRWNTTGVRGRAIVTLADAAAAIAELVAFARAASDFLGELAKLPIVQGKLVTVTTDGTTNANYFEHNLGRPYVGIAPLGQNWPGTATLHLHSPGQVAFTGQDAARVFGVTSTAAQEVTFSAWVF